MGLHDIAKLTEREFSCYKEDLEMTSLSGRLFVWLIAIAMTTWLAAAFTANRAVITIKELTLDACVMSVCD